MIKIWSTESIPVGCVPPVMLLGVGYLWSHVLSGGGVSLVPCALRYPTPGYPAPKPYPPLDTLPLDIPCSLDIPCPLDTLPPWTSDQEGAWDQRYPPPPRGQNDRHLWKHYLPQTSLACSNQIRKPQIHRDLTYRTCFNSHHMRPSPWTDRQTR